MKYFSTRNKSNAFTFSQAVLSGLAPDGGLFLPESIPSFKDSLMDLEKLPVHQRIASIIAPFTRDEISFDELVTMMEDVFNFPIVTRTFDDEYSILELFHGPTLAFKDFGARFLARMLSHFVRMQNKKCVILVATSGDTGSAVANAFYDIPGIEVIILYPKGKVSINQEKQLTTFNKNITAFEVEGVFDDCQKLVKTAFLDETLTNRYFLTSANSINIARLLPQSIYYVEAFLTLYKEYKSIGFTVPSGNLGNLSAGLLARKFLGLETKFTAALNSNNMFGEFLSTGTVAARPSVETLSSAMDVGDPSNLERITSLFPDFQDLKSIIVSHHFNDSQTIAAVKEFYSKYKYVIDPHTAVGFLGAKATSESGPADVHQIILSTAHPAKFPDVIEQSLGITPQNPERLATVLLKEKKSTLVGKDFDSFKEELLKAI